MPTKNIVKNLRQPNYALFNAIRDKASTAFQERIPPATKASIKSSVRALHEYTPLRNEFIDALYNKIGLTLLRSRTWENPLAIFKLGIMQYGDTIEEVNMGLLNEYTYDANRDSLEREVWGQERPEVQSSYHKLNRQAKFKVTVNEAVLMRAFDNGAQGFGLSEFISKEMDALVTSDNWNEFLLMTSLFKEYEEAGGFYNVNVPDLSLVSSDSPEAKAFAKRVHESAMRLTFLSRAYNASGMPVFAKREDLVLFATPSAMASLDIDALAGAFNIEKMDLGIHTVIIPEEHWNLPGTQAILTTKDFFVVADTRIEFASIQNPDGLYTNHWLHHWQIISVSRFVPAIRFSTDPTTVIPEEDVAVTAVNLAVLDPEADGAVVTAVKRNGVYQVETSVAPANAPSGVLVSVDGPNSSFTRLTDSGVLIVGHDETAASITFTAKAIDDETKTKTVKVTVSGDVVSVWNPPEIIAEAQGEIPDPPTGS